MKKSVLALLIATAPLRAQSTLELEDLDALDARITEVLDHTAGDGTQALSLDRRLHLAKCAERVSIEFPFAGAVALRCPSRGWRLRVPLLFAAKAETPRQEILVHRGDVVELDYIGDGFTLSAIARAMDQGAKGQSIRVVNASTGTPASAFVFDHGLVVIRPGNQP